jgi:hypothetical protein
VRQVQMCGINRDSTCLDREDAIDTSDSFDWYRTGQNRSKSSHWIIKWYSVSLMLWADL